MSLVQHQCSQASAKIVEELEKHFRASKVMVALGIVYLQYWVLGIIDDTFPLHMAVLKAFYGVATKLDQGNVVHALVDV